MKKFVGVLALYDEFKESYWMLPGYMKAIEKAGAIPVMLPITNNISEIKDIAEKFDGFLFTGGHDVSPEIYNEKKKDYCGSVCYERDEMEDKLLHFVLEKDKPILGICRGIQFINASLGGTLYQDINSEYNTYVEHHQNSPYSIPVHKVRIPVDSPLFKLLEKRKLKVNSYHHQAIKDLSPKLKVMALSEDNLIEGVYMPDKKFVWALQWHPEFVYNEDDDNYKILKKFVENL